tara:strand:+ start:855 stop:1523 length:669 start_codon:yes stop_codon:yes gene_type:complete
MFSSPFPKMISFICKDYNSTKNVKIHKDEERVVEFFKSQKRKNEFVLGRKVAHLALKKFKLDSEPILRNNKTREPCWPESFCGSITHSGNLAAAAVGMNKDVSGVGIDLEQLDRKINFNISKFICVDKELNWLKQQQPEQANFNLRIIFSAKESIFKCFFPISKKIIKFKDATVSINEEKSEFYFKLSSTCSDILEIRPNLKGFFSVKDNFILTSTYIKNIN